MGIKWGLRYSAAPVWIIFAVLLVLLAMINARFLEIGFLSLRSIDEYACHGYFLNMYDGLREAHIMTFLTGFHNFNYGFGFFLISFIVTLPFIASGDTSTTIYLPRLVVSLFALGGLVCMYRVARSLLSEWSACLFILLAISMPAVWVNATWFHPDWVMTAFLLAAIVYFARNDNTPGRDYWRGVFLFGLSVGVGKFQALVFLPFFVFYIFRNEIAHLDFSAFVINLKRAGLSAAIIFGVFVVTNPYLLHPTGLKLFLRELDRNLSSNTTAHGWTIHYSVADKIGHVVFDYYLNPALFVIILGLIVYWCVDYFRAGQRRTVQALAFYCAIYLGYLLLMVNKDWQAYYLNLLIPALFLAVPLLATVNPKKQLVFLVVALLSQVVFYQHSYAELILNRSHDSKTDATELISRHRSISDFIKTCLAGRISQSTTILISPYMGFAYDQLGLGFRNVEVIYGPLRPEMISAESVRREYPDSLVREINLASLRPKDFIILRKDDLYFRPEEMNKRFDLPLFEEAVKIIKQLDDGEIGYHRLTENNDVVIYQRIVDAR